VSCERCASSVTRSDRERRQRAKERVDARQRSDRPSSAGSRSGAFWRSLTPAGPRGKRSTNVRSRIALSHRCLTSPLRTRDLQNTHRRSGGGRVHRSRHHSSYEPLPNGRVLQAVDEIASATARFAFASRSAANVARSTAASVFAVRGQELGLYRIDVLGHACATSRCCVPRSV